MLHIYFWRSAVIPELFLALCVVYFTLALYFRKSLMEIAGGRLVKSRWDLLAFLIAMIYVMGSPVMAFITSWSLCIIFNV